MSRTPFRTRYSAASLLRQGLAGQTGWGEAWRAPSPKPRYDFVIIGGGGHGLATAYYLAKLHGANRVAVLEKGWIGGGNTGRNTTIVRSNYFFPESAALYDHALRLYEGLSQELNYNIMLSQRGVVTLGLDAHEHDPYKVMKIRTPGFAVLLAEIARLGLPTVLVQEGGYLSDDLGPNIASALRGFAQAA